MVWLLLGAPAVVTAYATVKVVEANLDVIPPNDVADVGLRTDKAICIKVFHAVSQSIELERHI